MRLTPLAGIFRAQPALPESVPNDLGAVRTHLGGTSLYNGLFRWFDEDAARRWEGLALSAFPSLAGRVRPFAADWLGRQFALDMARRDTTGDPEVLLLDVGAGEVLEIPATLSAFHEDELVDYHDAAVASTFYEDWRRTSEDAQPLSVTECVGYTVPLFLGGEDTTSNLDRTDAEVYWTLTGQLLRQVN